MVGKQKLLVVLNIISWEPLTFSFPESNLEVRITDPAIFLKGGMACKFYHGTQTVYNKEVCICNEKFDRIFKESNTHEKLLPVNHKVC